jgi:hypothetical protein
MSLVKTIGELSDYANSVGGLLRLKRREEEWVHVDEWIALNTQIRELEKQSKHNYDVSIAYRDQIREANKALDSLENCEYYELKDYIKAARKALK